MKKLSSLVLAAGMGSRYGGLKQIDPVGPNGETIIDYSAYDALRAGFSRLVFVIRQNIAAQFKEIVGTGAKDTGVPGQARVRVRRTNDSWFRVTYREGRPQVVERLRQLIARGNYPAQLWT